MEMMRKSKVMAWLINNDHKGHAITISDFGYGSHTINVDTVKLVIGNDLFDLLSKSVSIIDEDKTPLQDLIDQLTIYKDRFDGDPIVNRYIGIAINEAKARLIDEKEYLNIKYDIDDVKKLKDSFYSREEAITYAFNFYYDMSNKMKVPFNLISENRDNAEEWFKENLK